MAVTAGTMLRAGEPPKRMPASGPLGIDVDVIPASDSSSPPVFTMSESGNGTPGDLTSSATEMLPEHSFEGDIWLDEGTMEPESTGKNGMLQGSVFRGARLLGGNDPSQMGIDEVMLEATLAMPGSSKESAYLLIPHFQANYLDGPGISDMPPSLYETWLEFRWYNQFGPKWGLDLAAAPGVHSDFRSSHDAFRTTGRVAGVYNWLPSTTFIAGAIYLGREDVSVLPVGGVIYQPSDDTRLELIFPRPKLARRMICDGNVEYWVFLAGESGGDSYAIERAAGFDDIVTYTDIRAIIGIERRVIGGVAGIVEAGWVFDRDIEYEVVPAEFEIDSTAMLRAQLVY